MLVLNFLRFVFGYVTFTAKNGFPERFINLCKRNNILLWNLKSENSVLTACTDISGYKKIRRAAKKSGMKVRLICKNGLPFFLAKHSRRAGVLVGVCFCICSIAVLSTRIWSIDVVGNERVSGEEILSVFEELGLKKGVAGAKIDLKSTEIAALQKLPELSWLNVNIDGSAARIEVRETIETPQTENSSTPSDIVAARNGRIVILRSFAGKQEQKVGNAVLKGDPLISGIVENKDLTVSFCRSKGYVVAETNRTESFSQSTHRVIKKASAVKKSYIIDFLTFSFSLGKRQSENVYQCKSEAVINGVTLPVAVTECRSIDFEECTVDLSESRVKLAAMLRFIEKCTVDFRYLQVKESKITKTFSNGIFTVDGNFLCLENIGSEIPMEIEESKSED